MDMTESFQPNLSVAELRLLGHLNRKWPLTETVRPETAAMGGTASNNAEFVDMIQSLNDNGLILYEAFLMEASSGLRFIEMMITPRGKAALRMAEVEA